MYCHLVSMWQPGWDKNGIPSKASGSNYPIPIKTARVVAGNDKIAGVWPSEMGSHIGMCTPCNPLINYTSVVGKKVGIDDFCPMTVISRTNTRLCSDKDTSWPASTPHMKGVYLWPPLVPTHPDPFCLLSHKTIDSVWSNRFPTAWVLFEGSLECLLYHSRWHIY